MKDYDKIYENIDFKVAEWCRVVHKDILNSLQWNKYKLDPKVMMGWNCHYTKISSDYLYNLYNLAICSTNDKSQIVYHYMQL